MLPAAAVRRWRCAPLPVPPLLPPTVVAARRSRQPPVVAARRCGSRPIAAEPALPPPPPAGGSARRYQSPLRAPPLPVAVDACCSLSSPRAPLAAARDGPIVSRDGPMTVQCFT
ncbi:MAG: hypothetical protein JO020_27150 [Chloroflexi bacterium]|nr:hypothetical protein [Chloroflexota bacterium]